MNTELLLRVREHIQANPELSSMERFRSEAGEHCIGGWAVVLSGQDTAKIEPQQIWRAAMAALNPLNAKEVALLYLHGWPPDLQQAYRTRPAAAMVTAIDRFLEEAA